MFTDLEEIIDSLLSHFNKFNIDFFIVGAKARDILAKHAGLKESPRKTSDVDFAILVDSWHTLEKLRQSFASDDFIEESSDKNNKMRYKFKGTPFDIVPFGKNIETNGQISFPPFYETILTVVGYSEAMSTAQKIKIGKREIKVTTAEMLVGLKLISWDENNTRDRDAKDINYIFANYLEIDADIELDIYDNFPELVDEFDGEIALASIQLMGIRLSRFTNSTHKKMMVAILKDDEKRNKLSRVMNNLSDHDRDEKIDFSLRQLNALLNGLEK